MKAKLFASFALTTLAATSVHSQTFTIDWFTVDGGGGASAGGGLALAGTMGQPDAGAMNGGGFSLTGGFWSLHETGQSPPPLRLAIRRLGTSAVLSWPVSVTGFTLEYTTQLGSGIWTTESVPLVDTLTEHTVSVPALSERRFHRLRKP